MKRFLGLCTAAFFLSVLPGAGFAQTSSGVPPMLETQRPLAMPANQQPEPRAAATGGGQARLSGRPGGQKQKINPKNLRGGGGQTEQSQKSQQDCQEKVRGVGQGQKQRGHQGVGSVRNA